MQYDLAGAITVEPFVGDGRPGNLAVELLQFFTLTGTPAHRRMKAKAVRVDMQLQADGLAALGRLCTVAMSLCRQAPTVITSQCPIKDWHPIIGEPTVADAILDRLLHHSCKIELKGESIRKTKK